MLRLHAGFLPTLTNQRFEDFGVGGDFPIKHIRWCGEAIERNGGGLRLRCIRGRAHTFARIDLDPQLGSGKKN